MLECVRREIIRMIRAAHERAAGDVDETHHLGGLFVFSELVGMDKLRHRQMLFGRLQILAERRLSGIEKNKVALGLAK